MSQYDFRTLSPLDFEELVRDLLQAELGFRFESFGPGRDLGIDFRFSIGSADAVVQAKHYAESGFDALVAAAKREDSKIQKLRPARYLLATSVSLNPVRKAKLKATLPSAPFVLADVYGREDLNNLLGRHPEVEKRHFKLWLTSTAVLDRIIHSGVYNRTQAEMDEIRHVVPKFVQNDSVPRAQAILEKAGTLIIAGEPGVGKSTLARMLIWIHAQQGWTVSVIDDVADAFSISHEGERRLVFFDDFLGQVRLTPDWVRTVDQRLPPFLQRVKSSKSLRFIMTTRDYVLRQAQAHSERLSGTAFKLSEFTLNVGFYTRAVKSRILFNHIFFCDLVVGDRRALLDDDFFLEIIKHRNFNPRIISLLTSADYLSLVDGPVREAVRAVLDNPQILWEKPYRSHITEDGRALMLALFFNSNAMPFATLEPSFRRISNALGRPVPHGDVSAKFNATLKELEGSILAIENRRVSFSNPGVRDYLQRVVAEDRLLPLVVSVLEKFAELEQAWVAWCAQSPAMVEKNSMAAAWTGAVSRLLHIADGTALQRLGFVIDLYDVLQTDELANLADQAIDDLARDEIEGDEADKTLLMLEHLTLSLLPIELLDKARDVVTRAGATMLREYGFALRLDEIESVSEGLLQYGCDDDLVREASYNALSNYVNDLGSALDEIESIDELRRFEEKLQGIMYEYGLPLLYIDDSIDKRLEVLLHQQEQSNSEGSGWRAAASPGYMSDEEIRSLFGALREG